MGRLGVRHPGHYCRTNRVRFLWTQAHSATTRDCQWIAGATGVRGWARNRAARSSLSFSHRIYGGCRLLFRPPRCALSRTAFYPFRFTVRRCPLLFFVFPPCSPSAPPPPPLFHHIY